MELALGSVIGTTCFQRLVIFDSVRQEPLTPLSTTRLISMVAYAVPTGKAWIQMSVTSTVRTAAISPGLQTTYSPTTQSTLPVVACQSKGLHKATPTAKTSAQATLPVFATAAMTVDGAGLPTARTNGPLPKPCAGASPLTLRLTSVGPAKTTTMAFAAPTAPVATGLGPQTTHCSGNQRMQAAGARLQTSKRRSLGVTVARSPMVSVAPTVVSAAGPGSPTIPINGLEKVQPAGANIGGVIELYCESPTEFR